MLLGKKDVTAGKCGHGVIIIVASSYTANTAVHQAQSSTLYFHELIGTSLQPWDRSYYDLHLTDEQSEAEKGK